MVACAVLFLGMIGFVVISRMYDITKLALAEKEKSDGRKN